MPYQSSRQHRSRLNNLLATRHPRRPSTPVPAGDLYRVTRAGASMGQLIRAESASAAIAQYRALFRTPADVVLTVTRSA